MSNEIKLQIVGENRMSCSGCERGVINTLSAVEGVETVKASHESQVIVIQLNDDAPSADIFKQELATLDYEAVMVN